MLLKRHLASRLTVSLVALFILACGGGGETPVAAPPDTRILPIAAAPAPLTPTGLQNIKAFARLYGRVRFFHPSDGNSRTAWDALACEGVRQVEGETTIEGLQARLQALFVTMAPTVQVFPTGQAPAIPTTLQPPGGTWQVAYWDHRGVGGLSGATTQMYKSERKMTAANTAAAERPLPASPYEAPLTRGLSARVPMTLYTQGGLTLPASSGAPYDTRWALDGQDRATRLGSLVITWNVIQHFYPYFNDQPVDWEAAFEEALERAAQDTSPRSFASTLQAFMARLQDGHGWVSGYSPLPEGTTPGYLPLALTRVEGAWRVAGSQNPALKPGEAVRSQDGQALDLKAEALARYLPFTNPVWRDANLPIRLVAGPQGQSCELEVVGLDGASRKVTVPFVASATDPQVKRPATSWKEWEPGIYYINLGYLTQAEVPALAERLATAKGILLDARDYPEDFMGWFNLFAHFSPQGFRTAAFQTPAPVLPDGPMARTRAIQNTLPFRTPLVAAPKVFLADSGCISQMEYLLQIAQGNRLGRVVGTTTGGTNGDVNPFAVPTGHRVMWTGLHVRNVDGSRFHGIGVIPDIPVALTAKAL
ncbi:MAG: S41 family peptidase, partial [Holophaga sp.]|nr:S41 family peptidase [Holophaga sp.]